MMNRYRLLLISSLALLLAACATQPVPAPAVPVIPPVASAPPCECKPELVKPEKPAAPPLQKVTWEALPDWKNTELQTSWGALLQSCRGLGKRPPWQPICAAARDLPGGPDAASMRQFYERWFAPYRVVNADGGDSGLVTGYYEPVLKGARNKDGRNRYPLYGVPDDLLMVELGDIYPELKGMRLRGRLEGRKIVPYYPRADIEAGKDARLPGKELAWVEDPVELFFLQIQGSGRIRMADGSQLRVGYADQNGFPYKAIGKVLIEQGELTADKLSMQSIRAWARQNPDKLADVLNANPSYVFFRELPMSADGPPGALSVPLTPGYSIAVDPKNIPLGSPVLLSTTWPNSDKPLQRLVLAQDTGGAIRGAVRADFFWGMGDEAGELAGRMKQAGHMWVFLPKNSQ